MYKSKSNQHLMIQYIGMKKIIHMKLRIVMSFIFLWAFFDKLLGLGFATTQDKAWINGGSPTTGFLSFGTEGPLASIFQSLSGIQIVDWLFMLGLLFVGLTLLCKRFLRWGAIAGSIMMFLMYLATFPPENNPLIDEHIVFILVFWLIYYHSKPRSVAIENRV